MTLQNAIGLLVFVVVCGFIAYAGDLLGRRMGKKRLTLFGMRPRYTAIAMTTVTGMMIAILTMTIMAAVDPSFKQLLLRGSSIFAEIKTMENQLASTKESFSKASKLLAKEKIAADQAQKDSIAARKKRDEILAEKNLLDKSLVKLKADLRRNEEELSLSKRRLAASQADLLSARRGLTSAKVEIARRQADIKKQKEDIAKLDDLRAHLAFLYDDAVSRLTAIQTNEVTFRFGDEMARSVIDSSSSKAEIKQAIIQLLDAADKRAKKEGCVGKGNGRAVEILRPERDGKMISEAEIVDVITDTISESHGKVVARVISFSNTVQKEQALVDFALNTDRLVYKSGEEVASTVIDGRMSNGLVFGAMVQFFKASVRSSAINKGVIPSTDDEGQLSVGQIPGDMLFDFVDRIRASGTRVRLHATALKDTTSADTLALELSLGEP